MHIPGPRTPSSGGQASTFSPAGMDGNPMPTILSGPERPRQPVCARPVPGRRTSLRVRSMGVNQRGGTMRFLMLVKGREDAGAPPPALMQAIGELGVEAMKQGLLLETGGLFPVASGSRVLVANGAIAVESPPTNAPDFAVGG